MRQTERILLYSLEVNQVKDNILAFEDMDFSVGIKLEALSGLRLLRGQLGSFDSMDNEQQQMRQNQSHLRTMWDNCKA